ncbi:MAG: hypothetical protein MUE72_04700 [Chitinophagaceae bacterium]|jgi:hypothetical protein|nr:hypothetical protein [Chitinophagaceae bacterium]
MKFKFWIAFIAIILFSVTFNQVLFDTKKYLTLSKELRNFAELFAVFFTGCIGLIYFAKSPYKELNFLWKLAYALSTIFLLIITITDNYLYSISKDGQYGFYAMKRALTSPIIFLIFFLMQRFVNVDKTIKG